MSLVSSFDRELSPADRAALLEEARQSPLGSGLRAIGEMFADYVPTVAAPSSVKPPTQSFTVASIGTAERVGDRGEVSPPAVSAPAVVIHVASSSRPDRRAVQPRPAPSVSEAFEETEQETEARMAAAREAYLGNPGNARLGVTHHPAKQPLGAKSPVDRWSEALASVNARLGSPIRDDLF